MPKKIKNNDSISQHETLCPNDNSLHPVSIEIANQNNELTAIATQTELKIKRVTQLKEKNLANIIEQQEIQKQLEYNLIKTKERKLAHEALLNKLQPRSIPCPSCFGSGENCKKCNGNGSLNTEPDMRAIELVLKPEFPKTSVNINAKIQNMNTNELLTFLQNMKPVK